MSADFFKKASSLNELRNLGTRLLRNYDVIGTIRCQELIYREDYETVKDILYRNMAYIVRSDQCIEEEFLKRTPDYDTILMELYKERYYGEKMVLSLRDAIRQFPLPIVDDNGVRNEYTGTDYDARVERFMNGYRILAGARLPSKNTVVYARNMYWWKPIEEAISAYSKEFGQIPRLGRSILCFIDHYPIGYDRSGVYDADNVDIKPVTDAVMAAFLLSDSATELSIYQTGIYDASADVPYTEIVLAPQRDLYKVMEYIEKQDENHTV